MSKKTEKRQSHTLTNRKEKTTMHHDLVSTQPLQPVGKVITTQHMTSHKDNAQELTFVPAQLTWLTPEEFEETKQCARFFDDRDEIEYLDDEDGPEDHELDDEEDEDDEDDYEDEESDEDDEDYGEDDDFEIEI